MSEIYTLTIFSAEATNRIAADFSNYSYYVNWGSIIPEKYRHNKFLIKFSFYIDITSNQTSKSYLISANGLNIYNQNFQGLENMIGCVIIIMSRLGSAGVIGSNSTYNPTLMGSYSNSNTLNICIEEVSIFAGINAVVVFPNCVMTISFSPIILKY
jgi:hypothetical protein